MLTHDQLFSMSDEFMKISATRYEKAIREGALSRGDVTPGVPELPGPLGVISRKMTRDQLASPAPVASEALEKTRALKDKLHKAQVMGAEHIVPGTTGTTEAFPGVFAGMVPKTFGGGHIGVPEESGQFLRGLSGGLRSKVRALQVVQPNNTVPVEKLLPARAPVDSTLNHAVTQHELGESSAFQSKVVRPNGSHLGVEPILREQIALRGDPEATGHMNKMRLQSNDDAHVQKLIRRAGGTPDAPLAVGGKQQRAVERMLDKSPAQLDAPARFKALMLRDAGMEAPYVPKGVPGLQELAAAGKAVKAAPGIRGKLQALGEAGKSFKSFVNFTKNR